MTITALGTQNTEIGPPQWADMAQALAPRFVVDSPDDLHLSWWNGQLYVHSGHAIAAGTRISNSWNKPVDLQPPSSGSRTYAIILRIDWSKPADEAVTIKALRRSSGMPVINSTTTPKTDQINRIPGVIYDALLARVVRTSGGVTIHDLRCWGGEGGPLRVTADGMAEPHLLDLRKGTFISTDRGDMTKRLDDDGVWRDVLTESNPWRTWNPRLRYYKSATPNGVSGGHLVGLGNGGTASARYRVVDGVLDGFVHIRPGATGATLGQGPVTLDLPLPCANWQEDTWSQGHFYNFGYGGDGNFDWHAELLVKAGWRRGLIWVNPIMGDARMEPYRAADTSGQKGTGKPYIAGGYTVGVMTFNLRYPVDV